MLSAKLVVVAPNAYADRFQIYVGGKRIFDTGEYRSTVGGSTRSEAVNGETRRGDYFEIDLDQENKCDQSTR